MGGFMVERYWPDVSETDVQTVNDGLRAVSFLGVSYLGCTLVPEDEVVLFRFEAANAGDVEAAGIIAGLRCDRIVPAVFLDTVHRYAVGMANDALPDPSTPFGRRVADRLRTDTLIWLTTVGADGTPQPNPVWFVAEGTSLLIFNRPDAVRLGHIRRRPRVALNFDSDDNGDDVVVLVGTASIEPDQVPAHEVDAYRDKYGDRAAAISGSMESFAGEYSVAVRVEVDRVRGF
ncbi:MAG TPA: TIGR03667 family PPOX class F420-dependent oxidoreductase [Micromonosporaceae bacterium]|jgi:PPOX class probable F420-dependent enzyme